MCAVRVLIEGDAPILQHAFSPTAKGSLQTASKARTGVKDYSLEWMDTMCVNADGLLCQPSVHLERSMIAAAGNFKVAGKRGKAREIHDHFNFNTARRLGFRAPAHRRS